MKVFVLALLVLNLMCFALGDKDQKSDFVDLDAADGDALPQVEDYVEDEEDPNFTDDLEDDGDDSQQDEESDEPEDPEGFKDDDKDDDHQDDDVDYLEDPVKDKLKEKMLDMRPVKSELDAEEEPTPTTETTGSGMEPKGDADLKQALDDKLGFK